MFHQKIFGYPQETPITIDLEDKDLVSRVVKEVLSSKKFCFDLT